MARPRKDGKPPAKPLRIGAPRPTLAGGVWRVAAYAPTPGAPHGRVAYRNPETGRPTSAVPVEGQTLDDANPSVQDSGSDRNYSRTQQTIDLAALLNLEWEIDKANTLRSITFLTRRTDKNSLRWLVYQKPTW